MNCNHGEQVLRYKVSSLGVRMYQYQCARCGLPKSSFLKHAEINKDAATPWDKDREDQTYRDERKAYDEGHQDTKEERDLQFRLRNERWRAIYEAHLVSDKWRELCRRIRARDNGICQGCGVNRGEHVHHRTYERLGHEMLFDLVLVCTDCHERIHPHMREAAE